MSINMAFAAETQVEILQKKIDQLELELNKSNLVDEKLKFMEKNNDDFQEDLKKNQDNLISTFNIFIAVAAFLFGVMAVVLSITIGQSRKEFKENINDSMNIMKSEVERQFDEELKDSLNRNKLHFLESIEEEKKTIQQMIERELAYKKVRVLVTGSKDDIHIMKTRELKPIERRGITDITLMPFNELLFKEKLMDNESDCR
jgi:acetone carboxylase gamma subunit